MGKQYAKFFCLLALTGSTLLCTQSLIAQNIDCAYPIIFIHGFTGNQESFEDVYTNPDFIACYGDLTDTYHAVLNANSSSHIWGADGIMDTADDDVLLSFDNETNDLAPGCVYAINFNNYWNEDENNPEIDINGCGSPGFSESDSNESAILKGGYALGDMIQKVLDANPDKEKVILVGHSMGGLTAREYLQRTENNDNSSDPRWWVDPFADDGHQVAKLVTTVSPHLGSNFFGNPWPLTDRPVAETRDGLPDPASEATRDLRYSYSLGCGFLGLESCPGAYLFGGEEDDIWGYWNEDVDCDGDESSTIVGINEAGSPDEWDGTKDNPNMPLPTNLRYTWITSDIFLDSGDGVVSWDRQWLHDGTIPIPSDGTAHRLTDTMLTDQGHLSVNSDEDLIVRGLDEGDYPKFAWDVQMDNLMGGLVQVRSTDAPEGINTTDPDWFVFDIPNEVSGDLIITFNPHPSLSGQIDFFSTTPADYANMTTAGDVQSIFSAGDPTIVLTIPSGNYTPGDAHYFRIIHQNINDQDWQLPYDFEITLDAPLPVELLYFSGQKVGEQIELNWSTLSEFNSDRFEIMRSFNGVDYSTIGTVRAAGFSQEQLDYQLIDNAPLVGQNYYRLRQVDQDGKTSFSNIVILNFEKEELVIHKIYPNPSRHWLNVDYYAFSNQITHVEVFDMIGRKVMTEQFNSSLGNQQKELNINNLEKGIYVLVIQQGRVRKSIRFTKM